MDTVEDGLVWIMGLISDNPTEWWAVLALGCIALVWLVGRSARASRF